MGRLGGQGMELSGGGSIGRLRGESISHLKGEVSMQEEGSGPKRFTRCDRRCVKGSCHGNLRESIEQFVNNFANQPNETNMNDLESDDESVDTALVSPFPHSDNDSDDGEVLNELSEYENAGILCRERIINSFNGDDLAFQCMIGFRKKFFKENEKKILLEAGDGVRIYPDGVVVFDEKKLGSS
ncbi:hypothetical protein Tco_0270337 [Tanacetum coccineum]